MISRYHYLEPFQFSLDVRTEDFTRIGSFIQVALCPTLSYMDNLSRCIADKLLQGAGQMGLIEIASFVNSVENRHTLL